MTKIWIAIDTDEGKEISLSTYARLPSRETLGSIWWSQTARTWWWATIEEEGHATSLSIAKRKVEEHCKNIV